jgi:para-nitrobenzyl esterase
VTTATAVAVVVAACSGQTSAPASAGRRASLVVGITDGQIRGKVVGSTDEYLGIPYAAPPVGQLRWRPPQPPARWRGIRVATHFAPHCPQQASVFGRASTSENCLYLNVFRPAGQLSGNPPVMF